MPDRKYKILHLDDEETLLKIVQSFLEDAGYEAYAMDLKRKGFAWILENKPDLVISDIRAPEVDGIEFVRMLRADPRTRDTRVLILTGVDDLKTAKAALELGVLDYVTKPFQFENLLRTVQRVLQMTTPSLPLAPRKKRIVRVALAESPGGWLGPLRSELESRGMQVTVTGSFEELLSLATLPEQDLVILSDLEPGAHGGREELISYLRARYTHMHVLAVTGAAELHLAMDAIGTASEDCRSIPFNPRVLTDTIEKLMVEERKAVPA